MSEPTPDQTPLPPVVTPTNSVPTTILGFLTLALLATTIFLYLQNQKLRQQLSPPTPSTEQTLPSETPTPTSTSSADLSSTTSASPVITSHKANSLIKNPLKITGTVPKGWMFEGSFPVYLTYPNGTAIPGMIATAAAEVVPGSWQTDDPVKFTATLTFKVPDSSLGFIVLEKDNPSGLPENKLTFRLPIRFK